MTVIMICLLGATEPFHAGSRRLISSHAAVYDANNGEVLLLHRHRIASSSSRSSSLSSFHSLQRWKAGSCRVSYAVLASVSTSIASSMPIASSTTVTFSQVTVFTPLNSTIVLANDTAGNRKSTSTLHSLPSKPVQSIVEAYDRNDISLFIGLLKDCAAKNHRLDILPSIAYPKMQALLVDNDDDINHYANKLSDSIICDMLWIIGAFHYST